MATIGFIGVGNMGGPMARNLLKAGHAVKAFDLMPDPVQKVVDAGGSKAATAAGHSFYRQFDHRREDGA